MWLPAANSAFHWRKEYWRNIVQLVRSDVSTVSSLEQEGIILLVCICMCSSNRKTNIKKSVFQAHIHILFLLISMKRVS